MEEASSAATSTSASVKSCATCDAYRPNGRAMNRIGQCRRRAPVPLIVATQRDGSGNATPIIDGAFPLVRSDSDCEEYRRKGTNGVADIAGFELPEVPQVGPAEAMTGNVDE